MWRLQIWSKWWASVAQLTTWCDVRVVHGATMAVWSISLSPTETTLGAVAHHRGRLVSQIIFVELLSCNHRDTSPTRLPSVDLSSQWNNVQTCLKTITWWYKFILKFGYPGNNCNLISHRDVNYFTANIKKFIKCRKFINTPCLRKQCANLFYVLWWSNVNRNWYACPARNS